MKKSLIIVGVIVLILVLSIGSLSGRYNNMVTTEENISGKWAQVETQLQRRIDLIPNLVSTVKGYAEHEQETFTAITEARSKAAGAQSVSEKAEANTELAGALSKLMVVVERYPDLKANQNFIRLQDELAGTENRIAVTRKDYNDAVQQFNTYIKHFPNNIIAGMFNFEKHDYFKADEGAKEVPKVEF
ncbi:LemA protein [Desulfonispora thiosulfatigenes DSM 11270]|uniref:LemA protein n=1 Tax=Desulfonispora thiosulfatigenes DSM 11270 TaxID=656914 RepID=A0A1W1VD17_DESTI|nr:LemA family protein [Desulfonispora thiosulfatigenes]SMB91272.1 LemA protein [Desulfonispora thiosulfatigenes DSM 11270]